ncbi:hypothetical protein NESM_000286900 [Novymonas esmeraldas]|uniref:SMP-LTD domain-containing protein n=1 Tax=Novymonas esmeraldas TaxID=1808958 RepID=A0AAW0F6D5_9TRYP
MLATVLHVLLFVAGLTGLLAIKQRRLRHIPTRRTHIPRRHAEGTLWLQRLVNALLDMLHSALAEQQAREAAEAQALQHGSANVWSPLPGPMPYTTAEPPAESTLGGNGGGSASAAAAGTARDGDADSEGGAEVLSELPFLNSLKAQLEEQISALLEDKGIASFADLRIRDWGGKPPIIKAVYLSHGGGGGRVAGSTAAAAPAASASHSPSAVGVTPVPGGLGGSGAASGGVSAVDHLGPAAPVSLSSPSGAGPPPQSMGLPSSLAGGSFSHPIPSHSFSAAAAGGGADRPCEGGADGGSAAGRSSLDPSLLQGLRYRHSGDELAAAGVGRERSMGTTPMSHLSRLGASDASVAGGAGAAAAAAAAATGPAGSPAIAAMSGHTAAGSRHATDTARSLSVLEAEAEVEYSGNFSVSLTADLPIARGRYLQVYVSVSDVRMLAAHVRLRLALDYEPATVESPQPQPYLSGTLWLLSDPTFDAAFHSTLTHYRVHDFFLVPKLVKLFLLRFIRTRLRPSTPATVASSARHAANQRRRAAAGGSGGGVSASSTTAAAAAAAAAASSSGSGAVSGGGGAVDGANADAQRAASDASGLSFRVKLPADVVDGGEQWWSLLARDSMSEQPVPVPRAYHPR